MKLLVLYQDIQSGSKIATEAMIRAYKQLYPADSLIIYKQRAYVFRGPISFLRNFLWSNWNFWNVLRRTPSVDCIYSAMYTFVLPWRLSHLRHVPAIFHVHGDQRFEPSTESGRIRTGYRKLLASLVDRLQMLALTRSSLVAFVSKTARNKFMATTKSRHLTNPPIVISNGVDQTIYRPRGVSSALEKHRGTQTRTILYVGRIDHKKGIHNLIKATGLLTRYRIRLYILYPGLTDVYSGVYMKRLKEISSRLPSRHMVRFVQNVSRLVDYYRTADVLVLPSQQEMLPLVLLESLACGTLAVASDTGDIKDILSSVSPKLLLESTSPESIAKSVEWVFSLPGPLKKQLKRRARKTVNHYSWERAATVLHTNITGIIQR